MGDNDHAANSERSEMAADPLLRFKARVRGLVEREIEIYNALLARAAGSDPGEQSARARDARMSAERAAQEIERLFCFDPGYWGHWHDDDLDTVRRILNTIYRTSWGDRCVEELFEVTQKLLASVAGFPAIDETSGP